MAVRRKSYLKEGAVVSGRCTCTWYYTSVGKERCDKKGVRDAKGGEHCECSDGGVGASVGFI